jgi:hypothetical protein
MTNNSNVSKNLKWIIIVGLFVALGAGVYAANSLNLSNRSSAGFGGPTPSCDIEVPKAQYKECQKSCQQANPGNTPQRKECVARCTHTFMNAKLRCYNMPTLTPMP